ncbi:MAG TPA: ABC transporter permease [Gaiellaceae bacterium]|nr:ABC transporter permease [Gaiellaceae bacterium]
MTTLLHEAVAGPVRSYEHFLAQYRRVWRGTIGTSLLNPLLFLAAMGIGLGTLVDASPNAPAGVRYLDFVAPGLLAAAAMQTAATESSFPVMAAMRWSRTYHAMLATPLRIRDVLLGHQLFVATRVLVASAAYLGIVAAFGSVKSPLGLLVVPVAVLLGAAFAGPVMALAATVENGAAFPPMFRFAIMPMFLFSGTFFPVERLPLLAEWVAYATPLWHAVALSRSLTLGAPEVLPALGHVSYLALWAVAGAMLAAWRYRKALGG